MLAAVAALAQAAAQECEWPVPEEPLPPVAATPEGVDIASPEDLPIQVKSGGVEMTRQGDAKLVDGVVVRQGNRQLSAQSATYDATERRFDVEGDVEYRATNLRLKGSSGTWNSAGGGRFAGTEFELPARPARGSAAELRMSPEGELHLERVRFTGCPVGNDDWYLRASSIDIDQKKQQGTGRDVRVELLGVPIFYTPVISFPVGDARKSGFLFPTLGSSVRSGLEIGVPYYYNLAPNYDLTLTPWLMARRGPGIDGEFRYLTERSRGELEARYLPHDDLAGRHRDFTTIAHRTDLSDRLRVDARLAHASDTRYFEDFGLGPDGTSIIFLDRNVRAAWLGRGWRLDGQVQDFQTIDRTVDPLERPYSRLPQLAFAGTWSWAGTGLDAGIDAEATWFEREAGITGLRVDLAPRVAWALRRSGYFLEPSATYRVTGYELSDAGAGADDSPDRRAPILSVDGGLVLERAAGARGRLLQTLEPRLRYTWIPFRDQTDLPVFDTVLPDLNRVRLFRTNRYVGADRLGDANELAVGLTTRLLQAASARQFLAATIGQRFYFERPRVLLPGEAPIAGNESNLVGEIELDGYRHWSASFAMEWDREASNTLRSQASLQYRLRPDQVVNLGYRYREGLLEQWDASIAWRLSRSWQVFARQVYSLRDRESIDRFAGFEYGSCCWRIRLIGRRYLSNRTGRDDTSVMLQLELKGLSSVGARDDTFLQRGIRGYSAESSALRR